MLRLLMTRDTCTHCMCIVFMQIYPENKGDDVDLILLMTRDTIPHPRKHSVIFSTSMVIMMVAMAVLIIMVIGIVIMLIQYCWWQETLMMRNRKMTNWPGTSYMPSTSSKLCMAFFEYYFPVWVLECLLKLRASIGDSCRCSRKLGMVEGRFSKWFKVLKKVFWTFSDLYLWHTMSFHAEKLLWKHSNFENS